MERKVRNVEKKNKASKSEVQAEAEKGGHQLEKLRGRVMTDAHTDL